jgi:tRNA-splicing ligase RtcB
MIYTDEIDAGALQQLARIAELPIVYHHLAAMPDVHAGIGTTVGAVIPTRGAIIPAAVGVDIGCGMNALRLSVCADQLPDNLRPIRSAIEAVVPVGFAMHKDGIVPAANLTSLDKRLLNIQSRHPQLTKMQRHPRETWSLQLGTLGGGNHFIELCLDEHGALWVMLHSGSRGIGNAIGRYFMQLARKDMERRQIHLPERDLAYFREGAASFDDYVEAVHWAQEYAWLNRQAMMQQILQVLTDHLPAFEVTSEAINCHHNYVTVEQHFGEQVYLTRKGAIRAGKGDMGIIPGSMGAKSYIVRGLGNEESFCSCAHGAGRRMSRTAAKKQFRVADMEQQTRGVECRKDKGVIDEIPAAYKDIDSVMENQKDLVEIVHTLKQVVCIKG